MCTRKVVASQGTWAHVNSRRITLICTTIARPECARDYLRSVRSVLPETPILLAEQAEVPALIPDCGAHGATHLWLPFDCGLPIARNAMVKAISTDYFLLTEEDFRFPRAPDLSYCVRFLDAHPEFLCLLGTLEDLREKPSRTLARNFAFDDAAQGLLMLPVNIITPRSIEFEGASVKLCHMGPNWGVFRRSAFVDLGLAWDVDYTIGGEHLDFYLRLRRSHPDIRVGFSERLVCQHIDVAEGDYEALRTRKGWLDVFPLEMAVPLSLRLGRFAAHVRDL